MGCDKKIIFFLNLRNERKKKDKLTKRKPYLL